MKNKLLSCATFALLALFNPHHASAFSTVTSDARDSDGSTAFADPDDKKPAFMILELVTQNHGIHPHVCSIGSYVMSDTRYLHQG